jgi:hypothetical protein
MAGCGGKCAQKRTQLKSGLVFLRTRWVNPRCAGGLTGGLQQFDRRDFQRVALHIAADVHAKVVFLV